MHNDEPFHPLRMDVLWLGFPLVRETNTFRTVILKKNRSCIDGPVRSMDGRTTVDSASRRVFRSPKGPLHRPSVSVFHKPRKLQSGPPPSSWRPFGLHRRRQLDRNMTHMGLEIPPTMADNRHLNRSTNRHSGIAQTVVTLVTNIPTRQHAPR